MHTSIGKYIMFSIVCLIVIIGPTSIYAFESLNNNGYNVVNKKYENLVEVNNKNKINTKPKINIKTKTVVYDNDLDDFISTEQIIKLLDVKISDKEDEYIDPNQIIVEPSQIKTSELGLNEVVITYVDNGGLKASKEATIEIKHHNIAPEINLLVSNNVQVNSKSLPMDFDEIINYLGLSIIDVEDGRIKTNKKNVLIDDVKHEIVINVVDKDGAQTTKTINYEVYETNKYLAYIFLILIGNYFLYKKYISNKNK